MKFPSKKFVVWVHDPCPEGGWHIRHETDDELDAIRFAEKHHQKEVKLAEEMYELCRERGEPERGFT